MDYRVIILSIIVFLILTFMLVGILLGAKAKLLPSGPVNLKINGDNDIEVSSGGTLAGRLDPQLGKWTFFIEREMHSLTKDEEKRYPKEVAAAKRKELLSWVELGATKPSTARTARTS